MTADMGDRLVKATAAESSVRAMAVTTTNLVEEARLRHGTLPTATAALGRALTAGLLMGSTTKDKEQLSLEICGGGPLKRIMVTTTGKGRVRGYVAQPLTDLPLRNGKLDVGGAVGEGILCVIRTHPTDKETYRSITRLVSGEIGKDITYYLATSEQVPSAVGLGVLVMPDKHVGAAGGFMVQMIPGAAEKVAAAVEENVSRLGSVSRLIQHGAEPEDILEILLAGLGATIADELPVSFACKCDRDRVLGALVALGRRELRELIEEKAPAEIKCEFCSQLYEISPGEVTLLLSDPVGSG